MLILKINVSKVKSCMKKLFNLHFLLDYFFFFWITSRIRVENLYIYVYIINILIFAKLPSSRFYDFETAKIKNYHNYEVTSHKS